MHSHGLVISPSNESSRFFKLYSASPPHTLHSTRSSIGWRSHADCAALHSARSLADCLEELGHWRRLHTTAEGMRSDKFLWFPKNALSECVVSDVVHAKQQKDCRKRLKTDNKSVAHNFTRLRYAGSCRQHKGPAWKQTHKPVRVQEVRELQRMQRAALKTQHPTLRTFYAHCAPEKFLFFHFIAFCTLDRLSRTVSS